MTRTALVAMSFLLVLGCRKKEQEDSGVDTAIIVDSADSSDTGDTDTGDTDTGDTGVVVNAGPQGFAFCAAGGRMSNATHQAIICLGPMDIAGIEVSDANYTWQPGPIYILAASASSP